jgi:hypothetical protein
VLPKIPFIEGTWSRGGGHQYIPSALNAE